MRICIVGDLHFRLQLPYSAAVSDGRRREWEEVKSKIHETAKGCDATVLLGDVFNTRHNHSSVNRELVEFLNGFGDQHVYIIAGNHERYGGETALDFLQKVNKGNWHVFTNIGEAWINTIEGVKAVFLPYLTPGLLGVNTPQEATNAVLDKLPAGYVLFHHHAVAGTALAGSTTDHLNEIVLPREKIEEKYSFVFGGHIHHAQRLSEKTYVTGNVLPQESGDHDKYIHVLDTVAGNVSQIALPVRGIYTINWDGDMSHIPDHSIVKCIVTQKGTDIDTVKKALVRFDASIIVEQYPSERAKVSLDSTGGLDLSIDNLLSVYCKSRDILHVDIKDAMALLNTV